MSDVGDPRQAEVRPTPYRVMEEKDEKSVPRTTCKARGLVLFRCWGGIYLAVAVSYAVHFLAGYEYVATGGLTPGRCVWDEVEVEAEGRRFGLARGTLVPSSASEVIRRRGGVVQGGFVREGQGWKRVRGLVPGSPPLHIRLRKESLFHRVPWAMVLGLLNFLGLSLLLYTFLGDLAPAFLAQHTASVRVDLEEAQLAISKSAEFARERENMVAELEAERARLAAQAETDAEGERARLVAEAKRNSERATEALAHHLEADVALAALRLRARLGAELTKTARERLERDLGRSTHDELVEAFARRVEDMDLS